MKSFPFSGETKPQAPEKHCVAIYLRENKRKTPVILIQHGGPYKHPLPVIKAVCSSPHAIFNGTSFFSQNLLGTLSANLLFPKVKTAPDSDRKNKKQRRVKRREVFQPIRINHDYLQMVNISQVNNNFVYRQSSPPEASEQLRVKKDCDVNV